MSGPQIHVVLNDSMLSRSIRTTRSIQVLRSIPSDAANRAGSLFVLSTATGLPDVQSLVHSSIRQHVLKMLLVRSDINAELLPQMFHRAGLRTMKNTLVYTDLSLPRRVLQAWRLGAADQLIAHAAVVRDRILIVDCSLNTLEIEFDQLPCLRQLSPAARDRFEIDADGSCLHWPEADVHLDLDAARYATDAGWRKRQDLKRITHDSAFGTAIRRLREEQGLTQDSFPALSPRQLRRIEGGAPASSRSLEALSEAHGMELNEYLDKVAQLL